MFNPKAKFTRAVVSLAGADIAVLHATARQQSEIARCQRNSKRRAYDELLPVPRIDTVQNRANDSTGDPYRQKDFDLL